VVTDMVERGIDIKALVYVAAFAPAKGEAALDLVGKMPGSQLGAALAAPILLADGSHDLAVDPEKFIEPFALDLPEAQARLMAVTQRPINERALKEPSSNESWSSHPSFFIYGSEDKSIPPALQEYMAKRAHSRETIVVPGASHLVMLSHPEAVAGVIEDAAQAK
jgi:pimeloyl-ACP methyl ester carboxylesterase